MKITDTIHAIRHPFRLLLGEGRYVERFVYSYLIVGERIAEIMDEGCRYIGQIDALVQEIHAQEPHLSGEALSRRALERLGITIPRVLFMVEASFKSHLR